MSGLLYFKSLLPLAIQKMFLNYIEHPIAKLYKLEVLNNNAFILNHHITSDNVILFSYSGISYMWWSHYLVRDDEIYLPDEFEIDKLENKDILINAIDDYVVG